MAFQRWLNLRYSFTLAQISPKMCQITILSIFFWVDSAQDTDLAHLLEDLNKSEKLSKIKPPLKEFELLPHQLTGVWSDYTLKNNLFYLKSY